MRLYKPGDIHIDEVGNRWRVLVLNADGTVKTLELVPPRTFCERWRDAYRAFKRTWKKP